MPPSGPTTRSRHPTATCRSGGSSNQSSTDVPSKPNTRQWFGWPGWVDSVATERQGDGVAFGDTHVRSPAHSGPGRAFG